MGIWLWTSVSWDGRAFLRRGSIDDHRSTRWRNHSAQNWAIGALPIDDFLPFLLTTAGLFKDQKISVYKFACCCLRDTGGSLGGEDKPQPLQFEARGIWKAVSHWRKVRRRKKNKKNSQNGGTTDVSGFEKREVTQVVGNSAASRSRSSSIFPLWIQIWHSWHSYHTWRLWHLSTLLAHLALLDAFDTLWHL